jgi:PP-loop superfamily ATP-utilizing enzyme
VKITLPKNSHGLAVAYGGGVDSTAMLIALRDA